MFQDWKSPTSLIEGSISGMFVERMVHHKKDAVLLRREMSAFLHMLKNNPEERRGFSINMDQMAIFMTLVQEPGIDDANNILIHDIFIYLSEVDRKGDREGLRNMIACTFLVQEWTSYNKMVDDMLDRGLSKLFQKTCHLYSLYTFVNEIRRRSLPPAFFSFVSDRARQLVRGLTVFPDNVTLGYTLECLWTMISAFEGSRKTVVCNNGGFVLLQVARNNLEHTKLVGLCLKILSPLTALFMKSHPELYSMKDGIYDLVMEYLVRHMEDSDLVGACCSILRRALIGRPQDAKSMFKAKMKYVLGVVKSNHMKDPDIEMNVNQLEYLMKGSIVENIDGTGTPKSSNCTHNRGRSKAFWDHDGKIVRTRHARSAPRPPVPKLYSKDYERAIQRANRGF